MRLQAHAPGGASGLLLFQGRGVSEIATASTDKAEENEAKCPNSENYLTTSPGSKILFGPHTLGIISFLKGVGCLVAQRARG